MNLFNYSSSRWRKRSPNRTLFFAISLGVLSFLFFCLSYREIPKSVVSKSGRTIKARFPQCSRETLVGERFFWFAPHSGFSNQLSELKNAILMAAILNRTLIIPPVLDHHAVALGSCPKFRVSSPNELRLSVWNHAIELLQTRRYVSMADIVDLSSLVSASTVRTIDFRVFASLWCGLNVDLTCIDISEINSSLFDSLRQCGSLISGLDGNVHGCLYALQEDCRTVVWTYQQNSEDVVLDSFQPDEQLKKKKKISYVRRRRDVFKALGPGSEAEFATVLAFGSLFTAPYRGSELYIDIHEAPKDHRIQSLLQKIEFLPFVPEIMSAGKEFVSKRIKAPFFCAQLRLLDGQFKNHWKATFFLLEQRLENLRKKVPLPIQIFLMTDLPQTNWTYSYLGKLVKDSDSYRLYYLREGDGLVIKTAEKLVATGHGMKSSSFLKILNGESKTMKTCPRSAVPDILLFMEETVCSCASLGFVGTAGSTIADSIDLMRKKGPCLNTDHSKL